MPRDDLDELHAAYAVIKEAAEPFPPRVQAMAHTALLAECVVGAFEGDPEEVLSSLRTMIERARAQRPRAS